MRAGIFGKPSQETEAAIAEGLRTLGFAVEFQRAGVWTEDQARPYDLVVVRGLRLQSRAIRDHYAELGVPVLIHDLPALRKPGYFSLWDGEINALPADAPDTRLEMVDLKPVKAPDWKARPRLLVCGQKAGDAAHGMDKSNLKRYFSALAALLQDQFRGAQVIWRPHPQERFELAGFELSGETTLEEELARADLGMVATFNSTCGVLALEAGIPVECHPSAFYAAAANGAESRESLFSRLTHTQWTLEELRTLAAPYWAVAWERVAA